MKVNKLLESNRTDDYLSIKEINWLKDNPGQEIKKAHYKVSYNDYVDANTNEPMGGHFTVIENQGRDTTRVDGVQELKDYIVRRYNKYFEESISSSEPVVKFKGKSAHTFTKDKKWEVDFDEEGNILARTRHGKPQYFSGHINDSTNDFPSSDEDNIILAAKEQHGLKFGGNSVNEASEGFQKEFYNDYVILKNRAGDGWDIYSYDGTPEKVIKAYLEDEGYASLKDAKAEIDKWISSSRMDESFTPSSSGIQSVKCYNRYNYTIQELRVDNDNKTFQRGQFTAGKPDKKTKNRQEFEDIVDTLKSMGYKELDSEYRSMRNKSRNGMPTNESSNTYYVTVYEEVSTSGPEEGGYTSYGWEAIHSKKFNSKDNARKYLNDFVDGAEVIYNSGDTMEIKDEWGNTYKIRVESENERGSSNAPAKTWAEAEMGVEFDKPFFDDDGKRLPEDPKVTAKRKADREALKQEYMDKINACTTKQEVMNILIDKKYDSLGDDFMTMAMDKYKSLKESKSIKTFGAKAKKLVNESKEVSDITQYRDELQKYLDAKTRPHNFFVDATFDNKLCVEITWGDWKHEHMACDWLVKEFFKSKGIEIDVDVEETESNDGDAYSATHYYDFERPLELNLINESTTGNHFQVGDVIEYSSLYGGSITLTVEKIQGTKMWVDKSWVAEDTGETMHAKDYYFIQKDEEGNDCIIAWSYAGEQGLVYPPSTNRIVDENPVDKETEIAELAKEMYDKGVECCSYDEFKKFMIDNNDTPTRELYDIYDKAIREVSDKETMNEASYGGAFDIEDDQYFTRDEINELGYEVCEHLNEIFPTFFDVSDVFIEDGILDLTVIDESGVEYNSAKKIDMRKIKKPSDLNKAYVLEFVYDIRKQVDAMKNESLKESIDTNAIVGPQEGAEFGISELLNQAIQHELETISEYNSLSLSARSEGFEDIAMVIEEINTEENKHIGQLQELLKVVSPNASAIDDGRAEGEEQLSNPVPQEI